MVAERSTTGLEVEHRIVRIVMCAA